MIFEELFLVSLALTIVIETIVLLFLARLFFKKEKLKLKKLLFAGFFASFATLPYLWFVIQPFVDSANYILIGEIVVILAEAVILNQILELKIQKALLASIICNTVSFIIGQLILQIFF